MLPAPHRLHRSDDIRSVARSGRRLVSHDVILHVAWVSADRPGPRFCVIVSKAVGNAVQRNVVRRRLREISRSLVPVLPAATDVIVRARESAHGTSFDSLESQVHALAQTWLSQNTQRSDHG